MRRWVTFDLDGTLMQNPFGKWVFPEIEAISGVPGIRAMLIQEHELRLETGRTLEAYDWDDIVKTILSRLGVEKDIDVLALVHKHAVPPKVYVLEDAVLPVLKRLRADGYALAVLTNGYRKYQYPVLEAIGISGCFDEIVTPELFGFAKPNPGMLDGLRQTGEIAAHVGDRLDHDVALAAAAGTKAVLVNRSLPAGLLALTPHERTLQDAFTPLLERLMVRQNHAMEGVPLPSGFRPDYVIGSLEELPGCLS